MRRDTVKLQEIAKELDALTSKIKRVLDATPDFVGHTTLIVPENALMLTVFSTDTSDISRAVSVTGVGEHIRKPAYAALAFRMAMMQKHVPDASMRPVAFTEMTPEMIGELHFLQDFILLTFNQEIDFHVEVELSSECTGLVDTFLLITPATGNTYRTKVSGCSRELLGHVHNFDLFDGVKYGSVLVSE